jgi:hypothetical protein
MKKTSVKKKTSKPKKTCYLATIRKEKGYATPKEFAEAYQKHLGPGYTGKSMLSLIHLWERGNQPNKKNLDSLIEFLKLDTKEAGSLRGSFSRKAATKKALKTKPKAGAKKPPAKKAPVKPKAEKTGKKAAGYIYPEDTEKFHKAVLALGKVPIATAKQMLDDFAGE